MNPLLSHALCQTLLHHGSGEDAVTQLSVSRQEFKEAYYAVENQIPGLTLDFEKLAAKDPIESDPLIAQGNLSILRLDDLYRETFQAWRNYSQGQELSANKRTIKPGSVENRTDRSEKTEITTKQTTPDATLINQAVNIVLASFRIQATLTHRREQLQEKQSNNGKSAVDKALSDAPVNTPANLPPPDPRSSVSIRGSNQSQPEASARNAFADNEIINHTESLDETFDDFLDQQEKPIQKIRGLNQYTKLTAYKTLDPQEPCTKCQQTDTTSPQSANTPSSSPPPDPCESVSIRGSEPDPYIELPPYSEIPFQPPDVQEFLRSIKEKPTYINTS